MAGKPRSEWSDTYRRRVERAEAAGKSRQAARGHKAKEHVTRAARNRLRAENLGLTTAADRAYARAYGRRIAIYLGLDSDDAAAAGGKKLEQIGAANFRAMARRMNAERAAYKREVKAGTWISKGVGYLEAMAAEFEPGPDREPISLGWYFYH